MFRPNRMLSPSSRNACNFLCNRCCSNAVAIVDYVYIVSQDHTSRTTAAHLSTGAETGQPDGRALLADELGSFFVRNGACGRAGRVSAVRGVASVREGLVPAGKVMLVAMLDAGGVGVRVEPNEEEVKMKMVIRARGAPRTTLDFSLTH